MTQEAPITSVLDLLLIKDPKMRYGLHTLIGMEDRKRWVIQRALKARKGEKHGKKRRSR